MPDSVPSPATGQKSGKTTLSRVRIGLIVAVIFFSAAGLGGWFWSALVFASIYVGNLEFRTLMGNIGVKPSQIIILATAVLMVFAASLEQSKWLSPILTLAVIASFFRLLFRSPRAHIGDIGGTLIVIFYMVYMPVYMILLRQLGLQYLVMTLVVISASDIAAYYVGKALGRHLLYPEISPKKTREGAIGGLLGGVLLGVLTTFIWPMPWYHAMILSALLVIVGQLGDLTESMMKRDVGLKDSGMLLASHGGFLDRADSYIFSGAVCYYYIYWIVLRQGLAQDVIHWLEHFH